MLEVREALLDIPQQVLEGREGLVDGDAYDRADLVAREGP
jgi:hypothetical protein